MTSPVLEARDIDVWISSRSGGLFSRDTVHALTGVSLSIGRGEVVGLVGESGCGKSTLARVLVGLQAPTRGSLHFRGTEVNTLSAKVRRRSIGSSVGMVFQDPSTALNRRLRVRDILRDPLDVHDRGTAAEREARVREVMSLVGLPQSAGDALPGELSGGQRQRVAIGRALVLEPDVLVADEPTAALDVSVRAQILNLLSDLKARLGLSMVFISHDIQTVRHMSDRIVTMYLGRIVEEAPAAAIPGDGRHPYTRALFSATPSLLRRSELMELTGPVPSAVHPPSGCPFRTRCWRSTDVCSDRMPESSTVEGSPGHRYRCFHPVRSADDLVLTPTGSPD